MIGRWFLDAFPESRNVPVLAAFVQDVIARERGALDGIEHREFPQAREG